MQLVDRFLSLADDLAPGLIEGLYAVGSLALKDFRSGKSDVDFVAITARPISRELWSKIKQAHKSLTAEYRRPWFSGIYVTWADLASDPRTIHNAAFHHEGQFGIGEAFEVNPAEQPRGVHAVVNVLLLDVRFVRSARTRENVAVAGGVDHYFGKDRLPPTFALEDNAAHGAAFDDGVSRPRVVNEAHASVEYQVLRQKL